MTCPQFRENVVMVDNIMTNRNRLCLQIVTHVSVTDSMSDVSVTDENMMVSCHGKRESEHSLKGKEVDEKVPDSDEETDE